MGEKPYDIRQRSFEFAKDIIRYVRCSEYEKIHHSIFDQVLRSGTSIGRMLKKVELEVSKKM